MDSKIFISHKDTQSHTHFFFILLYLDLSIYFLLFILLLVCLSYFFASFVISVLLASALTLPPPLLPPLPAVVVYQWQTFWVLMYLWISLVSSYSWVVFVFLDFSPSKLFQFYSFSPCLLGIYCCDEKSDVGLSPSRFNRRYIFASFPFIILTFPLIFWSFDMKTQVNLP